MLPLCIINFKPYLSVIDNIWRTGGAAFLKNLKMHLGKISLATYFKAIVHYFGLNSLLDSTGDWCMELKP